MTSAARRQQPQSTYHVRLQLQVLVYHFSFRRYSIVSHSDVIAHPFCLLVCTLSVRSSLSITSSNVHGLRGTDAGEDVVPGCFPGIVASRDSSGDFEKAAEHQREIERLHGQVKAECKGR
jgi:hypothetical protein